MKVLMAFHLLSAPPESGATKRTFHLLGETASRHDVSVVSYGSPDDERAIREHFGPVCRNIFFVDRRKPYWYLAARRLWLLITGLGTSRALHSTGFQRCLDRVAKNEHFDIVFLSAAHLAHHRLPPGVPVITDNQNVEYEIFYRAFRETKHLLRKLYYFLEYRLMKRDEIRLLRRSSVVLATSARDLNIFRQHLPDKQMFIVPNGTDISFFSPRESEPEPHTMVFPGVMNYHPNDQGIHYFLDEIFPRITARVPDAKIYVVGSRPSGRLLGRASDKIIVTGHVKDIRPYIAGAQVFVIPLWVGGGTRLKVLEAMAMKKPIVSTTIGCEGINVKHNESVLFADAPAEFADAVVRLFNDPVLRTRISTAAHTIVTQNGHTWRDIGQRLEEVYNATCPHGSIGTMEGVVHPAYYSNVL